MYIINFYKKARRFKNRNEGQAFKGLIREIAGKLYVKPGMRNIVRPFFPVRRPDKWAFVIGCYNSGTTLLRELLGAHPEISSLPREGVRFTDQFPDLQAGGWQRMLLKNIDNWNMSHDDMYSRAEHIIRDWSPWWDSKATVFLEKSIEHAVRMMWLEEAFDSPYFITIVRNGYCVCEGIRRRAAPRGAAIDEIGNHYPISLIAEQWVRINEQINQQSINVQNVYSLKYEDLSESPLDTMNELFSYLDLEKPSMGYKNDELFIGNRFFNICNMNSHSICRLSREEITQATVVMRNSLQQYGYSVLGEGEHD